LAAFFLELKIENEFCVLKQRWPEKKTRKRKSDMRTIIAVVVMMVAVTAFAQQTNTLDSLRQSYEVKQRSFLVQYGTALDTIMANVKKKADLDGVLILQAEQNRFGVEKTVPAVTDAREAFRSASEAYYQAMVTVLRQYAAGLDGLIKRGVMTGRIEEAKAVKAEKDKIVFILADMQLKLPTKSQALTAPIVTPPQEKTFHYNTSDGWLNTQIIVTKGQKISIQASGQWSPDGGRTNVDANGILRTDWEVVSYSPKLASGRVIAWIMDKPDKYIDIGRSGSFVAETAGELIIGINDRNAYDNKGKISIKVIF